MTLLTFTPIGVIAVSGGRFPDGTGAMNMDDLECNGTESSLFDCMFSENSDCSHSEDAGVFCGVTLGEYTSDDNGEHTTALHIL